MSCSKLFLCSLDTFDPDTFRLLNSKLHKMYVSLTAIIFMPTREGIDQSKYAD